MVTITGQGWDTDDATTMRCRFGAALVDVISVPSSTTAVCQAPAALGPAGPVAFELSANGVDYSWINSSFTYLDPPMLLSINPASGTSDGGTLVSVYWSHIEHDTMAPGGVGLTCHFGAATVRALSYQRGQVVCSSPAHEHGPAHFSEVLLKLSFNGVELGNGRAFTYYNLGDTPISSIYPRLGTVETTTAVSVAIPLLSSLGNRKASFPVMCRVSGLVNASQGHVDGHGRVSCFLACSKEGSGHLEVSLNGVDFDLSSEHLHSFTCAHPPLLISLSPLLGPLSGGTRMAVRGLNFRGNSNLTCSFGLTTVPADWLDSTLIACVSPPMQRAGVVHVSVSYEGAHLDDVLPFLYYTGIRDVSVMTRSIALLGTGNSTLDVLGTGFQNSTQLTCRLLPWPRIGALEWEVLTPCRYVSSSRVSCHVPGSSWDRLAMASNLQVAISNNGQDFCCANDTRHNSVVEVALPPEVDAIVPAWGPSRGGVAVSVHGENFVARGPVTCLFGHVRVPAEIVSNVLLKCELPPFSGDPQNIGDSMAVLVHVSIDGIGKSGAAAVFRYVDPVFLVSLAPPQGPASGGTKLQVLGANFTDTVRYSCCFGNLGCTATRVQSPGMMTCVTPMISPSVASAVAVSFYLTIGGNLFSAGDLEFMFYDPPSVASIHPFMGAFYGGTRVTVKGKNFGSTAQAWCQFGVISVPGLVHSPERVECASVFRP